MKAIHIRNVPDIVIQRLKQRAAANHRSMQKEVLHILVEATSELVEEESLPPIDLILAQHPTNLHWRREDMYDDDGR